MKTESRSDEGSAVDSKITVAHINDLIKHEF